MLRVLFSPSFLIFSLVTAFVYILVFTYVRNLSLVLDTIFGSFSLSYKANLLLALFGGLWTAMNPYAIAMLFIIGILTGANITLLVKQLNLLKKAKNLRLVVGGNTLLGIAGTGCAACGLPILSFLGISGSIAYLPFKGSEISFIAAILLSISFYLLLRSYLNEKYCKIPRKSSASL
jgi:hypothetical protein